MKNLAFLMVLLLVVGVLTLDGCKKKAEKPKAERASSAQTNQ